MRVKHNVIRHAKTAYARRCPVRGDAYQGPTTFIGNVDIPMIIDCRANRSYNARGSCVSVLPSRLRRYTTPVGLSGTMIVFVVESKPIPSTPSLQAAALGVPGKARRTVGD